MITTDSIKPGIVVDGRYKILSTLGQGGMGTVFRAEEEELNRAVAVKVLHSTPQEDADSSNRFLREGQALSTLSHKNIVSIYRYGIWQNCRYIAMEMLHGEPLRSVLNRETRFEWQRALRIASQVCAAMNSAHNHGILHRDLSPANIMLLQDPEPDFVKVVDFGLCKILPGSELEVQKLTQTGALVGSVYYMSPEQALGKQLDQRSDIYSLGCILYEMLNGQPPLVSDSPISLIHKHVNEAPPPLMEAIRDSIPPELELVLFKSLEKSPENRYQTMESLGTEIDKLLDDATSLQEKVQSTSSAKRKRKNAAGIICASGSAIAIIAIFAAAFCDPGLALVLSPLLTAVRNEKSIAMAISTAEFLQEQKHYRGAILLYQDALNLAEDPSAAADYSEARKIKLKSLIARCYGLSGNRDLAILWAKKSLTQAAKITYAKRGPVADHRCLVEGVDTSLLVLRNQIHFPRDTEAIINALVPYMLSTLNTETSFNLHQFEMSYFKTLSDPKAVIKVYLPIAHDLALWKRNEEAIAWLDKSIDSTVDPKYLWRRHNLMESYGLKSRCLIALGKQNELPALVQQAEATLRSSAGIDDRWEIDNLREYADLLVLSRTRLDKARLVMEEIRKRSAKFWKDPDWKKQRSSVIRLQNRLDEEEKAQHPLQAKH